MMTQLAFHDHRAGARHIAAAALLSLGLSFGAPTTADPATGTSGTGTSATGTSTRGTSADASKTMAAYSGWHFSLETYAWAFGMYGKVGVGRRSTDVSASFIDLLQDSDSLMAWQGHIEVQYQRFGIFFDGSYANIEASFHGSFASAKVDQELSFLELGGFYRIVEGLPLWHPSPEIGGGRLAVDALAGARYTYIDLDAKATARAEGESLSRNFDGDEDWVDPFFGGRMLLGLTEDIDFLLRGDIGGFGVGSDFTWNTQALLGYHFSMWSALGEAWAGYRAMGQDYDSGSGRNAFKWDVVFHGPVIGFTVRW